MWVRTDICLIRLKRRGRCCTAGLEPIVLALKVSILSHRSVPLWAAHLDRGQVLGPHVLGGVHPESLDSQVDQVIDVPGDHDVDVGLGAVEVVEAGQVAVPDLGGVVVVANVAVRLVEIQIRVGNAGVVLQVQN